MHSFIDLDRTFAGQPRELGPVLARIDTGRGREQLFLDQVPQVLRQLSENARFASITASNAIEGVIVDHDRAIKIAEGTPRFRNRNEKEFAGYRDAVDGLLRIDPYETLSIPFVLHLHRQLFQPWISYLGSILTVAYDDFEASVATARDTTGNKQERVRKHILEQAPPRFRRRDLERALPGVSVATIRLVLNELRDEGRISVDGAGPGARWRRS